MKNIEVVCAVILNQNKEFFCCQRGYGPLKGYYEFPGGKIEKNETREDALIREIKEELNSTIKIRKFIQTIEYDYPEFKIIMHAYYCSLIEGNLDLIEHTNSMWIKKEELFSLNFAPADKQIINIILKKH